MTAESRKRGVRVFQNPILDWSSRAHPATPALIWVPIIFASWYLAVQKGQAWWTVLLLTVAGFVLWTLFEYILHRWIFHFVPEKESLRPSYYMVHQIHHDYHEWDRLVAPPMMSLTLGVFFYVLLRVTLGPSYVWPVFAGVAIGYLAYDYSHFYQHFGKPKSRWAKMLRRRHFQHHTTYPDRWYGVSSPFWDYVFGTDVKKGERPTRKGAEDIDWNPRIYED